MPDLDGNPKDRFSHNTAQFNSAVGKESDIERLLIECDSLTCVLPNDMQSISNQAAAVGYIF